MHGIHCLPVFELARVLVRCDRVVRYIVNADHKLSEKPKSHLAATAVGCDGPRDVDSVCSVFNGGMNRGDGLPRTRFASKYRALPLGVSRRSHIRGIHHLARSIRDVGSGGRGESVVATHRLSSLLS